MATKVVVIASGGLDSSVLVYNLVYQKFEPHLLSFNYGQRHKRELVFAKKLATRLELEHQVINLPIGTLLKGSSQTDLAVAVPEGHYEEESMKLTVVPNRNMIMLSIAVGWAISLKAPYVYYAAHAGDHAIYPDCRRDFVLALEEAISHCDWTPPMLCAPFLNLSKAEIVKLGHQLKVDFAMTWSCYKEGTLHCGKCGTCVERREAFKLAGVEDPTVYEEEA